MNRGDARLLFAIMTSAIIAAIATAVVTQLIATRDVTALEHRISKLESTPPPLVAPTWTPPTLVLPEPPAPVDESTCDEVSCVLNNYEAACCAKFNKSATPESLDRTMISDGIGHIIGKVRECGMRNFPAGRVKISVKVAPSGEITAIEVKETPDDALGTCVTDAVKHATFAKTVKGGSFGYPFVF